MSVDNIGVHVTHCCVMHGCKYGDPDCPVENKEVMQEYLCEECDNTYYDSNITMKQIEEVFNAPAGVIKPLTILEKLHAIEEHKCIYNIHYCKAGVGISFYYPERDTSFLDPNSNGWRKALSTAGYHKGFDECIEAEYDIMLKEISQNDE